jgi:hypothetical protein
LTLNGTLSGAEGLITVNGARCSTRPAIAAYSDFAGSIASHGMPAAVSCSSRCRTVCDLPEPVAPVMNA